MLFRQHTAMVFNTFRFAACRLQGIVEANASKNNYIFIRSVVIGDCEIYVGTYSIFLCHLLNAVCRRNAEGR